MTSAITNPMHLDVVRAVMGADVMMGHDPDCARWIRRFREAPSTGAAAAGPGGEAPRGRREGGARRRAQAAQGTPASPGEAGGQS
jgi:5-methyltetrahydrofolate--homocysteine methyltransferase